MIRCVESSGQRYGVNVILDTLRGASTAKIRQYEMDGNPEYGVCAKIPAHRLRQIFNYLVLKEYLHLTDDGYTYCEADCRFQVTFGGGAYPHNENAKRAGAEEKRETEQTSEICSR